MGGLLRALFFVVALAISFAAAAQTIPPSAEPGRERERFERPTGPRALPGAPVISLPSTAAPAGAERVKVFVRDIRIVGSTVYSADELSALFEDMIGREVTLSAIYGLARRVTAKYGNDGYVLSRAIVPPQNLNRNGAVVRIQVVEGFVNKIEWPASLARFRDLFSGYTAKIIADRPINIRTIERYLLLASDLPGLKFTSSLRASENATGAATLVIEVAEKPFDLAARIDNRGTQARGPYQFLLSATLNNLLGAHEAVTVSYAGATEIRELQYVSANYRQVLNSEGLTLFAAASHSWGRPGTAALTILEYSNESTVAEMGLSFPVIRARERNLTLTALMFANNGAANIFSAPFNDDRLRGFRLKADADFAETEGAINQFNATFSQGIDGLGSTSNGNPFASRAAGRVDFSKIEASASRIQPLAPPFSVLLAVYGQYAFTPLLAAEECGYGGRMFGRAFDPSQFTGDRCWMASAELRWDLPTSGGMWRLVQLYGFLDYGRASHISPAVGTPKSIEASSAGVGIRFDAPHLHADFSVGKPVDGPGEAWRFFFTVTALN